MIEDSDYFCYTIQWKRVTFDCVKLHYKIEYIRRKMEAKCNPWDIPNQIYRLEHEGYKYIWNVDKLIIDSEKLPLIEISIIDIKYDFEKLDIEYALKNDNSTPIIVIKYRDNSYELLDGNHRIYKAIKEGKQTIMAYCLLEKEADKYIVNKSKVK